MKLGVCYYPEQWDESLWADDARRMAEMGLSTVRIAEFAWGLIEPRPGHFEWGWLDRAIETLAAAGLEVVLGTPTAAPPRWLVERHPEILAVDAAGRTKAFGSRRHYCFSSDAFFDASRRVVTAMAERYGRHRAVVAWQTDNEYGCHDTIVSYSPNALARFRTWLAARYDGDVTRLNAAWGNVFWSMSYERFDDVGLPVATPAPPNPAHLMAFRRFASDEVVRYNRMQVEILRRHAPGRDVLHNFMGFFGEFEHHEMGRDLDIATWDNYPLGHLEGTGIASEAERAAYRSTGHPDIPAFHHDLYRGVAKGRWWIMEQQAGPVNWAPWNALPHPGMVRTWTWEAFAHGAELVSYFRWRQVPYAQEQLHSGLCTPDSRIDIGGVEATQVARELRDIPAHPTAPARVALVVDYAGKWAIDTLPNSQDFDVHELQLRWYGALRRHGLDVDIVPASADISAYALVVVPTLPVLETDLVARLGASCTPVVFGPRTGSRTPELAIVGGLPPGVLRELFPGLRVRAVEGLRPGVVLEAGFDGTPLQVTRWRDVLDTPSTLTVEAAYADGHAAVVRHGVARYVTGWLDESGLDAVLGRAARDAGLAADRLPDGLRLRRRGTLQFAFHYGAQPVRVPAPEGARFVLGGPVLETAGVAAWSIA